MRPVGLIAGNGKLPLLLAAGVRASGRRVMAVAHHGETRKDLGRHVDSLEWVYIGELDRTIALLKEAGAREVLLAGGVPKTRFFGQVRPDQRAIRLLSRLTEKKDDAILRALAAELETEGLKVKSLVPFLKDAMVPKGCLSAREPTEGERRDMAFGWKLAKRIGALDIGQCVVVKDQIVLAVEAIEGSDRTIRRGGRLGRGGAVVVKVCKPGQDLRLDLPVIGPATIRSLKRAGASALAVEAGKTIVIDRAKVVEAADRNQLCLIGL